MMGLLPDDDEAAAPVGDGQKFVDAYAALEPDDQEKIRRWSDRGDATTFTRRKLSAAGLHMGYNTVAAGLARLRESEWAS